MCLIFNLSIHTNQTSSFIQFKWSVSVRDRISSSLDSQFIRSSSQSCHHFSFFSVLCRQILLESQLRFQLSIYAQLWFVLHPFFPLCLFPFTDLLLNCVSPLFCLAWCERVVMPCVFHVYFFE